MTRGVSSAPAVDERALIPADDTRRRSTLSLVALIGGFLLTTLYFVVDQLMPDTGLAEFAYPTTLQFNLFAPARGFTFEQLVNHVWRVLVLGPGLLLLSVGLWQQLNPGSVLPAWFQRMHWVAATASLFTTAYVMLFILRGRAIVDDEVAYAEMARTFTRGRLAEPRIIGQLLDHFEVLSAQGITGKYLFGEALVQMLGVAVSVPALAHLPLNALTLFALYRSVLLLWRDRTLAAVSCGLLAISPTFMLCAATGQTQATSLCCVVLGILGFAIAKRQNQLAGGALAGAALAFGLTVRIQTHVPAGLVLAGFFIALALRTRDLRGLLSFGALSALGVGAVALYNLELTGSPFQLPWFLQAEAVEHYGFGKIWDKYPVLHTPLGALQNLLVVAVRMNAWWLGWPLALALVFRRSWLRTVWREGAIFIAISAALIVFELGYYSPGIPDVGPIYHFELLPCLSLIAAQFVIELWRQRPELALTGVMIHVLFGTGSFVWEQSARLGRMMHFVYKEPQHVLASLPDHSLLLYEMGCRKSVRLGWIHRPFALMTHDPRARVVTFARPQPRLVESFIAHFSDRACFYLDHDEKFEPIILPCAQAREQLMRPILQKDNQLDCRPVASTAERLNLL